MHIRKKNQHVWTKILIEGYKRGGLFGRSHSIPLSVITLLVDINKQGGKTLQQLNGDN